MNPNQVVFLLDLDNTLLDDDRVIADLMRHLEREFGHEGKQRYCAILNQLGEELGFADYLGALQRYRMECPPDPRFLTVSSFLANYPFANRLFPNSLDVVEHLKQWGTAVILSDGDVIFQPRKVERSGLFEAVEGNFLIYVHKEHELDDIEQRYPADHYVFVDDKLGILTEIKNIWSDRVTTVQPLQGQHAKDPKLRAAHPAADLTIDRIGDLLNYDLFALLSVRKTRKE
jgi:phosphoglycolate phosphatase-like HAD superfamily hydrolase